MALVKALSYPYEAVTSDYVLYELRRSFAKKFPSKIESSNAFLSILANNITVIKADWRTEDETLDIRDSHDIPVLRAALKGKCDILISGDKDFLESDIKNPKVVTAKEFLEKF